MPEHRQSSPGRQTRVAALCLAACLCGSLHLAAARHAQPAGGGGHAAALRRMHSNHQAHASGGGNAQPHITVPKGFVYVYDMPAAFTDDMKELPVQWHPEQYDYDQVLHKHFLGSDVRTHNPEQAQLFFIPVYLGRHYNHFWQQWSASGNAWDVHEECRPGDTPSECFWDKWTRAKEATSEVVRRALAHVKGSYPHWNASNGADHFMVFSYDHGRCDMALTLSRGEWGQMFAIQSYGDLTYTNDPTVPPLAQPWRENNYSWAGPKAWACFRPNADVLVPMYYTYTARDIVSPFNKERSISLLMRFGYEIGDGKNLVEHYGHRLRYELIEHWKAHPLPGSQQGLKSVEETEADMENAVFCMCAPGQTQDTVRMWRAIVKGCIPVTMYRANDLPFARFLGMPYEAFAVNIQPDDYAQLNSVVQRLLDSPGRLRRMQEALAAHQRAFVWDADEPRGVYGSIERELAHRAATLADEPRSVF